MFCNSRKFISRFHGLPILATDVFGKNSPDFDFPLKVIKRKICIERKTIVASPGDYPDICFLVSGHAKLSYRNHLNFKTIERFILIDEIFGMTEAIADCFVPNSLETVSECEFDMISRDDFLSFLADHPTACKSLVKKFSFELVSNYQSFAKSTF